MLGWVDDDMMITQQEAVCCVSENVFDCGEALRLELECLKVESLEVKVQNWKD